MFHVRETFCCLFFIHNAGYYAGNTEISNETPTRPLITLNDITQSSSGGGRATLFDNEIRN